jgi:hypothetical protein
MSDYAHHARAKLQEAIELLAQDRDYELAAQTRELCAKVRNTDPTGYYQEEAEALKKANDRWQESNRLLGLELEKTKAELKEVRSVSEGWEAAYNRSRAGSNAHLMAKDSLMEKCSLQAKQLKEYEGTVFELRNEVTEFTQALVKSHDEKVAIQEGISQLKSARNKEVKKFEEENADLARLREELEKCFQDEIDTNKLQAGIAEKTIATQFEKILTLEAKAEADHNRIVVLREVNEELERSVKSTQKWNEEFKAQVARQDKDVTTLKEELEKHRRQVKEWRVAELNQRQLKESHEEVMKEYQLEIDRLRDKLRDAGL